jgi:hypothetical protein
VKKKPAPLRLKFKFHDSSCEAIPLFDMEKSRLRTMAWHLCHSDEAEREKGEAQLDVLARRLVSEDERRVRQTVGSAKGAEKQRQQGRRSMENAARQSR